MSDYVSILKLENDVEVYFQAGIKKILDIGEKMNAICPEAYMNGYNWEAFFHYYLKKNAPGLLEGMSTDPEADAYVAIYPLTDENEVKASKFVEMIRSLIENEEELYRIVKEEGSEIEWD